MRKSAVFLFSIGAAALITACSSHEKQASTSESISETAEPTTEIVTEAVTETTSVTVTQPSETSFVKEVISISREDISDYYFDGETQTIGDDIHGYLEIPIEWEYEEPDAHKRAVMAYTDDEGNRIYMKNCDLIGWGLGIKDIDKLAEQYESMDKSCFNDAEIIKYELDGYSAYKLTYSALEAIQPVNYGDEYCTQWIFECEDGVNRSVGFSGSEDFIKTSDNIIKTYNLHN